MPSSLNTGLGSPTGMTFGTDSSFPAKFKNALFTADWQNGRILLVQMTPAGASYSCEYEVFLEGAPLNVCDMQFGPDGALYFITGGRGSQSGLYRVKPDNRFKVSHPVKNIDIQSELHSKQARNLRNEIEKYHVRQDADINKLWPHLNNKDRWLRFAARIAIENQDVSKWRSLALKESNPTASIAGLIALCRQGDKTDRNAVITALNQIDLHVLNNQQMLGILRAYQLCFIRLGEPTADETKDIIERLSTIYPYATSSVNHLLCEILVYLEDDSVVSDTVKLLKENLTQEEQIRAAFTLMHAKKGWNKNSKRLFLSWLIHAKTFLGGKQLNKRIKDIREDFLIMLSDEDQKVLSNELALLHKPLVEDVVSSARPFVKQWKIDDLKTDLSSVNSGRSFQNARKALLAANCLKCHRIGSSGAQIGPDLTTVGKRFDSRTILESIITPSKVMDEKYLYTVYALMDGKIVTGRPVGVNKTTITIETDLLKQTTLEIPRDEIEESVLSKVSPMPTSLIDVLTQEDIFDLLAYIKSGGNPDDPAFQKRENK